MTAPLSTDSRRASGEVSRLGWFNAACRVFSLVAPFVLGSRARIGLAAAAGALWEAAEEDAEGCSAGDEALIGRFDARSCLEANEES